MSGLDSLITPALNIMPTDASRMPGGAIMSMHRRSASQQEAAEHAAAVLRLGVGWEAKLAAEQERHADRLQQQADAAEEQRAMWAQQSVEHEQAAAQWRSESEAAAAHIAALTAQHEQEVIDTLRSVAASKAVLTFSKSELSDQDK